MTLRSPAAGSACAAATCCLCCFAAVASAEVSLSFEAPLLIAESPSFAPYADNVFTLREAVPPAFLAEFDSGPQLGSTDGGRSWARIAAPPPPAPACPLISNSGVPARVAGLDALRAFGNVQSSARARANYTEFNSTTGAGLFAASGRDGVICADASGSVTFSGLPRPATCTAQWGAGGCPFRLSGSDMIVLADRRTLLYAAMVYMPPSSNPYALSIVAFASTDGGATFAFRGIIADAAEWSASVEGPNENALSLASDGTTIVCVFRTDGGDGYNRARMANYGVATSCDGGVTWSSANVSANAGCARPRLLHLAADGSGGILAPAPLLLSGGRWANEGLGWDAKLWVDESGSGANFSMAASLSYYHNLLAPNASWRFSTGVNSTSAFRETSAYTALLALDGGPAAAAAAAGGAGARSRRLAVTYNRYAHYTAAAPCAAPGCSKNLTAGYDVQSPRMCATDPVSKAANVSACCALSQATPACPSFVYVQSSPAEGDCYLLAGFGGWARSDGSHTIGHDGPLPPPPPPDTVMMFMMPFTVSW